MIQKVTLVFDTETNQLSIESIENGEELVEMILNSLILSNGENISKVLDGDNVIVATD